MAFDARSFLEGLYAPVPKGFSLPEPRSGRGQGLRTDDLSSGPDIGPDDLPGDLRVEFEERAAIMEYDGGLPRERAEALALAEVLRLMRNAR